MRSYTRRAESGSLPPPLFSRCAAGSSSGGTNLPSWMEGRMASWASCAFAVAFFVLFFFLADRSLGHSSERCSGPYPASTDLLPASSASSLRCMLSVLM